MKKIKKAAIYIAVTFVNVIALIGAAGLFATGIYLLNSFLGLAVDVPEWRYGLVGLIFIICNGPFTAIEVKNKIEAYLYLYDL